MAIATMTSKGQLTVPKEIRDALGLSAGSRVEFSPVGEGEWLVRAVPTHALADLAGAIRYRGPVVTLEEMEEAIAAGFAGVVDDADESGARGEAAERET